MNHSIEAKVDRLFVWREHNTQAKEVDIAYELYNLICDVAPKAPRLCLVPALVGLVDILEVIERNSHNLLYEILYSTMVALSGIKEWPEHPCDIHDEIVRELLGAMVDWDVPPNDEVMEVVGKVRKVK